MDIFAHALWTNLGTQETNKALEKKEKKRMKFIWPVFWGIFPDLVAFGLPFLAVVYYVLIGDLSITSLGSHHLPSSVGGDLFFSTVSIYSWVHSFVIFAGAFFLIWLLRRKAYLPMLGWGLHIFLDIFSHSVSFYPTKFLYPISNIVFPYGVAWFTPWFMIVNYFVLFVLYFFFFKKFKNKNTIPENKVV